MVEGVSLRHVHYSNAGAYRMDNAEGVDYPGTLQPLWCRDSADPWDLRLPLCHRDPMLATSFGRQTARGVAPATKA